MARPPGFDMGGYKYSAKLIKNLKNSNSSFENFGKIGGEIGGDGGGIYPE